jgi:hypothetical protein
MPYPEPHVESSLPQLGSDLRAAITRPAVTDFLRRSLQIREPSCAFGLPRRASAQVLQRWLGGPHLRIKFGAGAKFDATCCEVALPGEQALELIDRVLGGSGGRGLVPSKAGLPSAAEAGVLAYFAARCVRACGVDLRVQDVTIEARATAREQNAQALTSDMSEAVVWPVAVSAGEELKLDLKLIFPTRADWPRTPLTLRLALVDALDETALVALEAGDLLLADSWTLHSTMAGLSGLLELGVPGSEERALLVLEGTSLRAANGAPPLRSQHAAELVLAELTSSFAELAGLLADEIVPCPAFESARLEARGRVLARGRLRRLHGQLALEVVDHSMR